MFNMLDGSMLAASIWIKDICRGLDEGVKYKFRTVCPRILREITRRAACCEK